MSERSRVVGVLATTAVVIILGVGAFAHAGDFNHDGFDDLAVGADGEDGTSADNQGCVIVIYGTSSGLVADGETELWWSWTSLPISENEQFGRALTVGDFDRDGYDDLAIGSPGHKPDETGAGGGITISFGYSGGLGSVTQYIDQTDLSFAANEDGDRFGAALATGDFNLDYRTDLAIGVPGKDLMGFDLGTVYVVYGIEYGLGTTNDVFAKCSNIVGGCGGDTLFGSALAAIPPPPYTFADGFETQSTERWSETSP